MHSSSSFFDFVAFGKEVKEKRGKKRDNRSVAAEKLNISPRYLLSIENNGQPPSLPVFCDIVREYQISADKYFHPKDCTTKSSERRLIESLLDQLNNDELIIVENTIKGILQFSKKNS